MSADWTVEEIGPGLCRTVLPSGITVLSEELPAIRSAAVGIWIRMGSRDEDQGEGGLSHFLEHILFKGTAKRTAFEISYEVEKRGGHIDAFTGRECTCFYARTLDRDLPAALEVLADIVSHPLFEPAHVEREKRVVLEEIAGVDDAPEDLIHDLLAETLWPGHPLGRPVLGTPDSVHAITPDTARAYWRRHYTADRMLVTVAGHFDRDRLLEQVAGSLDVAKSDGNARETMPLPTYDRVVRREDRELAQCYVCVGMRGVPAAHPARAGILILASILGGGASSRLFQSVREQAGLAYSVFTYADACRDTGIFATSLGVRPGNAQRALDVVQQEYARLRKTGLSPGELEAAQAQIVAGILLGLESTHDRMEHLAHSEMYRGRYMSPDEQVQLVEATTAADVQQCAEEFLDFDRSCVVQLGPAGDGRLRVPPAMRSTARASAGAQP